MEKENKNMILFGEPVPDEKAVDISAANEFEPESVVEIETKKKRAKKKSSAKSLI